ncbi:MAG: DNA polymerase III subunit alpha [Lentisphaerae bacterium]|nr:DNA polymerase III subunit alpha [Lentisphaerota bacterium]
MSIPFVHLHVHTDYSLLDGTQRCKDIAAAAAEYGMPAVAITDHGNMSGCFELIKTAAEYGIKPILGCELYVANGSCLIKDSSKPHYQGHHLVCLAENHEGYVNLCHLNQEAWLKGFYYKPRVDKELLRRYSRGIIALSACLGGEIPSLINAGCHNDAELALLEYLDIFGRENFFLELQNHYLPEQANVNPVIIEFARRHNVGLVATNDAHYLKREYAEAHDVFLCIGTQKTIQDPSRYKFSGGPEYYFKSPAEMATLFPDQPEALSNTVAIAERCNVHLPTVSRDHANHYPEYPVPEGQTRDGYLRQQCEEGMKWRYDIDVHSPNLNAADREKVKRLDYELSIINQTGFTSYFLVVWDFLNHAAKIGVPLGPGRGSGAGSIVAYVLGITHIDPLRYGLLFERFLNPDRVSPPDFDIDLCERRRYEVIEYVRDKYGADNVVQIGTFGTLKAKAVLKDVARVLGRSVEEGNRISKLIPTDPKITLNLALNGDPEKNIPPNKELQEMLENEAWAQEVWKYALVLEGMNRNMSIHAAGVIIGDQALANIIPIAKGAGDEPITQFPAGPCEELGLLKMDFLGLKTLTIIQDALDLVAKNGGPRIDSNDIPLDDKPTYDLLNQGSTIAVFQLESSGMQNLCRRFVVNRLEDIIALIALYRPGPMKFLDEFIGRKLGTVPIDYELPSMKPILEETYGIMLYQEQVMQVVQAVAGFSLGNADILRRAMGKKKLEVMLEQFEKFREGCRANNIPDGTIQSIWDKILKFAEYGFNKSHSAAYGLLSYRTAWLKANYPTEFMAAVLTSELGNAEKLAFYLKECHAMNINILPPDVNICDASFSVDGRNIRFGLAAVKNVGAAAVSCIVKARSEGGKFTSLRDFCERVEGNNKKNLEYLIKAGAMDGFGLRRSQLLAIYEEVLVEAQQTIRDRKIGQGSLFDMLMPAEKGMLEIPVPDIPEWDIGELLANEKELLGFYLSGHPIAQAQEIIDKFQLDDLSTIAQFPDGTMVRSGAYLAAVDNKISKRDSRPWAILTLESREATVEGLLFSDPYAEIMQQCPQALQPGEIIFVEGEINRRENDSPAAIHISRICPASQAEEHFAAILHIKIKEKSSNAEKLSALCELCRRYPGKTPIIFCLFCNNGNLVFTNNETLEVRNSPEFRQELEKILGPDCLVVKPSRSRPQRNNRRQWRPRN